MKALVTGSAGFIGSHLCDALVLAGYEVVGVDNLSSGTKENLAGPARNILNYKHDIRHFGKLQKIFQIEKPDVVFHLAAEARIAPSIDDPVGSNETNLTGTLHVLECCRRTNVKRIVFASSCAIYKENDTYLHEVSPTLPLNPYALQKLLSEQYIELYFKLFKLSYGIGRFFNVYGPRQPKSGAYAPVMGIFLRQAAEGKPLTINGNGSKTRDFVHVSDIVKGLLKLGEMEAGNCLTVNFATGKETSVKEIADIISPNQIHLPDKPGEMQRVCGNATKAKISLGWVPEVILNEEGIRGL